MQSTVRADSFRDSALGLLLYGRTVFGQCFDLDAIIRLKGT